MLELGHHEHAVHGMLRVQAHTVSWRAEELLAWKIKNRLERARPEYFKIRRISKKVSFLVDSTSRQQEHTGAFPPKLFQFFLYPCAGMLLWCNDIVQACCYGTVILYRHVAMVQ